MSLRRFHGPDRALCWSVSLVKRARQCYRSAYQPVHERRKEQSSPIPAPTRSLFLAISACNSCIRHREPRPNSIHMETAFTSQSTPARPTDRVRLAPELFPMITPEFAADPHAAYGEMRHHFASLVPVDLA